MDREQFAFIALFGHNGKMYVNNGTRGLAKASLARIVSNKVTSMEMQLCVPLGFR